MIELITWIVTITSLTILGGAVVISEIRDDRAVRRYVRERDARLRELFGDIHKR